VVQSAHRRCLPKRARPRPGRTNKQRVTPPRPIWCERAAIPARGLGTRRTKAATAHQVELPPFA
jgi:hypothetical protein